VAAAEKIYGVPWISERRRRGAFRASLLVEDGDAMRRKDLMGL
jgi:hypothetical protein